MNIENLRNQILNSKNAFKKLSENDEPLTESERRFHSGKIYSSVQEARGGR
jgi:hypothetical protein